jgi:hypothetical protein
MLIVETIARIRREHFIKGKTIKERQLPTASIPPMSFSISWPASVILRRRPTSSHRLR